MSFSQTNIEVQNRWETRSTVRSRPRLSFDSKLDGYFFPLSHQPLSVHPKIASLGKEAIDYLLVQSLYKYSNDIAMIETRVVNQSILKAVTNSLLVVFDNEQKLVMYTIMVDEAYHAYVAFDAMMQIQERTGIKPLLLPEQIEIEFAIQWAHENMPSQYHSAFDYIAVCLAENTLTKEIVSMLDKDETHPFFQKIIKDHLSDESRHSGIFSGLLRYFWQNLDEACKKSVSRVLIGFVERYLGLGVKMEFDLKVLRAMGFSDEESREIFDDTYQGYVLSKNHPMLKNILYLFEKSGLSDEILNPYLREKDWVL